MNGQYEVILPNRLETARERPRIVGLGEILWDVLPSGRLLGGAPTNFAYMATVLGDQGIVASRVGHDELAAQARESLQKANLTTGYLQEDCVYETGYTSVSLDDEGQPTFRIQEPVAWDYLQWTPEWQELALQADVICFGSLAQRSAVSGATISSFITAARDSAIRIFDVNLRAPFYNRNVLLWSLKHADILKLNEHELLQITSLLDLTPGDQQSLVRQLLQRFGLRLICVTRGARGSLLMSPDELAEHPGISVKVADAIGAGDAFTACVAHHYIRNHSLEEISDAANRFASWVATQVGATPTVEPGFIHSIKRRDPYGNL